MPDADFRAQLLQASCRVRRLHIRSADAIAKVEQNLGYAAHTNAADADKMNVFDFTLHESCFPIFSHDLLSSFPAIHFLFVFASCKQAYTICAAASGLPSFFAFKAISRNF